jgi:tetratricopeptide (TPR) repeat protein
MNLANETLDAHPRDAAIYMALADICKNLGIYFDKSYLDRAEIYGKKALEFSPHRQEAAFYLGRTYVLRNEAGRAVELNRRMVADYPAFPVAHWFLGLSLDAAGQGEEARREIITAWKLGYRFHTEDEMNYAKNLLGESLFQEIATSK